MIIGLTGAMGVGKSTAVEVLRAAFPRAVHCVKFAQPLYDIQEYAYNRIATVHKRSENFIKDRKLLQWIGTEWGREHISQTLWVDLWADRVRQIQSEAPLSVIVCDDVRFDNEAAVIHGLGGKVIQLTSRRTADRIDIGAGIKNHSSEAGINADYVFAAVANDSSLDNFRATLLVLFKDLLTQSGK